MKCPKCGWEIICGCSNCRPRLHYTELLHCGIEFPDDSEMCPNCNFRAHLDFWVDEGMRLYDLAYPEPRQAPTASRG